MATAEGAKPGAGSGGIGVSAPGRTNAALIGVRGTGARSCTGAGAGSDTGTGAGAGAGAGASAGASAGAGGGAVAAPREGHCSSRVASWATLRFRGIVGDVASDPRCRRSKAGMLQASTLVLAGIAGWLPDPDVASLQRTCVKLRCAALKVAGARRRVGGMDAAFANAVAALSRFTVRAGDKLPLSKVLSRPDAVIPGCTIKPRKFTVKSISRDDEPESAIITVRVECPDAAKLAIDPSTGSLATPLVREALPLDPAFSPTIRRTGHTAKGATVFRVDLKLRAPWDNDPRRAEVAIGCATRDRRPAQARRLVQAEYAKVVRCGVSWADGAVPDALAAATNDHIDALAGAGEADYHPGSQGVVRDLVHPALYPYVRGVSKFVASEDMATPTDYSAVATHDMWGRPYEHSVYQWLPTPFHISESGRCSVKEYINNLPRDGNEALYGDLESLFEVMLPRFEAVVGYAQAHAAAMVGADEVDYEVDWADNRGDTDEVDDVAAPVPDAAVTPVSLRGREVQVITKIVEYELPDGHKHESVWHVEGMSHENIIATGVYVAARSASVHGGALKFQRPFTASEGEHVYNSLNRNDFALRQAQKYLEDDCVPLGHLTTPAGRLFVFPNSHVHMVSPLQAVGAGGGRRRIVVFWLVNPETRIVSTREVPVQQGVMSVAEAREHRLKLMQERKFHKQTRNVRPVSLCEH